MITDYKRIFLLTFIYCRYLLSSREDNLHLSYDTYYVHRRSASLILRYYHLTSLLLRPGIKTGKHCCPHYRTYKHLKAMLLVYYFEAAGRKLFS